MRNRPEQFKLASDGKNSLAETLGTLITYSQLQSIRKLSAKLNIGTDKISQQLFGIDYEELSVSGAHDVIEYLKTMG